MKDEIRRVMKLVQEGKISPEDGAELIEAFTEADDTQRSVEEPRSAEERKEAKEAREGGVASIVEMIERIGKDIAEGIDWAEVAGHVKEGVNKGKETLKKTVEEFERSGGRFTIFAASESKTVELPLELPEGAILRVEGAEGDVAVEGGADKGSIKCVATFRGATLEQAKEKAEAYTPVLEEADGVAILKQPSGHDFRVSVTARVATGTPVEVQSTNGDVRIVHTDGSVKIVGNNGDIRVTGSKGVVSLKNESGDVEVSQAHEAVVEIDNKSGDVKLAEIDGNVSVRNASGDVQGSKLSGRTLSVETASGDCSLDIPTPVSGTVNVRTVSGNAKVALVDGSDCRVTLSTLRGTVRCDLELAAESRDAQRITGRLGNGEGTIDVSAVNGDVALELRDSVEA